MTLIPPFLRSPSRTKKASIEAHQRKAAPTVVFRCPHTLDHIAEGILQHQTLSLRRHHQARILSPYL